MTRSLVKGLVAAAVAAGLVLFTAGVALPARKPPISQNPRARVRPVVYYNQAALVAQGLTPAAALSRAAGFVKYHVSTAHYIPRGYKLAIVRVYPYIPYGGSLLGDTQTFMNLAARPAPDFEVDHQVGQAYDYQSPFTVSAGRLGGHAVSIYEEKVTNFRTHQSVDQLFITWYDPRRQLATEVTTDLQRSHLSRATVLKIAASVT